MLSANTSRCSGIPSNKVFIHLNCAGHTIQSPRCRCRLRLHVQHQVMYVVHFWCQREPVTICKHGQVSEMPIRFQKVEAAANSLTTPVASTTIRICKVVGGTRLNWQHRCATKLRSAPQQPSPCDPRKKPQRLPKEPPCHWLSATRPAGTVENFQIPKLPICCK